MDRHSIGVKTVRIALDAAIIRTDDPCEIIARMILVTAKMLRLDLPGVMHTIARHVHRLDSRYRQPLRTGGDG